MTPEQIRKVDPSLTALPDERLLLITAEEYRAILNDRTTSNEQIKLRLDYLEGFCRNIIKAELEIHANTKKRNHGKD